MPITPAAWLKRILAGRSIAFFSTDKYSSRQAMPLPWRPRLRRFSSCVLHQINTPSWHLGASLAMHKVRATIKRKGASLGWRLNFFRRQECVLIRWTCSLLHLVAVAILTGRSGTAARPEGWHLAPRGQLEVRGWIVKTCYFHHRNPTPHLPAAHHVQTHHDKGMREWNSLYNHYLCHILL